MELKSFFQIMLLSLLLSKAILPGTPDNITITGPRIIPEHIEVGPFFNGTEVTVNANIPECAGVIVKLIGKDEEMVLNKKGKKTFIWLNVSQVTVKNAPSIYILTTTNNLADLCSDEVQEKELLGYNSLRGKINFESTLQLSGIEFDEFIKLKEDKGNYSITNNAVISSDSDGNQILKATLEIPSFISANMYSVVIYCFDEGKLIDKADINLSVEEVGLPLLITNLAKNSPAIYGILAIIIAMIAGSTIALIFTKKSDRKK